LNLFRASGDWKLRQGLPMDYQTALSYKWKMDKPEIQARALVVAGDTLFVAGPPDVVDEEEAFFAMNDKDVIAKLAKQSEALKGKYGASLWAVSALKGQKLYEYKLDTLPVWDGMIAAGGKLYLSTTDGEVACLTGKAN
jgi:outer membrane protein assembly factor BamB